MTDLYLIAHKVRGEPAFDIASRMVCPECAGGGCPECDDVGYWWIVPTSGHRAYPWCHLNLSELEGDVGQGFFEAIEFGMPQALPDHYPLRSAPTSPRLDILALLPKAPPGPTIRRRL